MDNDNAMSTAPALRNPLILDNILAQLNNSDLKLARLVCREWNDIGVGLLGRRSFLEVNKIFRYDGSKLCQATPVNDKLMRSLIIRDEFDPSVPTKKTDKVITKVFTELFAEPSLNLAEVTQEIEFYVTLKKFATAFLNGLKTLESTQLQQISIFIHSRNKSVDKGLFQVLRKLPTQQNLTSLKFQIPQLGGSGIHAFQSLLQVLIDSAPKLTSLDVTASFCPSLEECKNLKVLKFSVAICHHVGCPDFEVASVTRMLTPVKDSLIELELCYENFYVYHRYKQGRSVDVPVMSNLTSLTINPPYVYLIQDFFDEEHLPRLKTLSLKNHRFRATKLSTHLDLWKRHHGVKSFALTTLDYCRAEDQFGDKIVQLFPAVKKLNLTLVPCEDCVNEMKEPFQLWGLDEVKLVVQHERVAAGVVEVLRNVAAWKGIKTVHFERSHIKQDDFSGHIQDIILYSEGFKRVEISGGVVPEIVDAMRPIFEASGAPVEFKGGVYSRGNMWEETGDL